MKKKSDPFKDADAALDKIQGDKNNNRNDRMDAIDSISNEIALLPNSVQRTKIIKRCCTLARQIEFRDQPNLI